MYLHSQIARLVTLTIVASGCRTMNSAAHLASQDEQMAEQHLDANHCEVFLDRIAAFHGPHGSFGLTFYLKTLNDRLDGPISENGAAPEVGLRLSCTGTDCDGQWRNLPFTAHANSDNYWKNSVTVGWFDPASDRRRYEGVFYVKTVRGTYYWAKSRGRNGPENFVFDGGVFRLVESLSGQSTNTQQDALGWLNPGRCY